MHSAGHVGRGFTMTGASAEPKTIRPRTNEAGVKLDPSLAFDRAELKNLLQIWETLRRGRQMPARADLDLFDLKVHLGDLFLVDVEREPRRFRYRLVGTRITQAVERDATGKYFDEIYAGSLLETWTEGHCRAVNEQAPLRVFSRTGDPYTRIYAYEGLLLPLAADGETVNMVLGELLFTPASDS